MGRGKELRVVLERFLTIHKAILKYNHNVNKSNFDKFLDNMADGNPYDLINKSLRYSETDNPMYWWELSRKWKMYLFNSDYKA